MPNTVKMRGESGFDGIAGLAKVVLSYNKSTVYPCNYLELIINNIGMIIYRMKKLARLFIGCKND